MAKFKGTNGDDTLVGTSGDDSFVPLLGIDSVDGGAGYDVLTVDYSAVASSVFAGTMTLAADGSWSGAVSSGVAGGAVNAVGFQNVERVVYAASQDFDLLTVVLGALALDKTRLKLDGGGGDDHLTIRGDAVDASTALTLRVGDGGKIVSSIGALASWETLDVTLGQASGNKVALGGGDDHVRSTGGRDTIDLGGGVDEWTGDYQHYAGSLVVTADDDAADVTGLRKLATVRHAETMFVLLGDHDDTVSLVDAVGYFGGGLGLDQLSFRTNRASTHVLFMINGDGTLSADLLDPVTGTNLDFGDFEIIDVRGGTGNDSFTWDASVTPLEQDTFRATIHGNGGVDRLTLDLQAEPESFVGQSTQDPGYAVLAKIDIGVSLSWEAIDTLEVNFGDGPNIIEDGVARHVTVHGGAGIDTIDFLEAAAAITIDLEAAGTQFVGLGDQTYTTSGVESVRGTDFADRIFDSAASDFIEGGGGDDVVSSAADSTGGTDQFYGEEGTGDRISYQLVDSGVTVDLGIVDAQDTGGGGMDRLSGFEQVAGSIYADVLTGASGDDLLLGNDGADTIEGGGGDDELNGGEGIDTVSYAHATAAVTVSLATTATQATGGAGADRLALFENLTGSSYADTLTGDANANVLSGGRGADALTGGGGADTFAYASTLESTGNTYDRINDFSHAGGDRIDLSAIDAISTNFVRNDTFSWIGEAAFHGVAGELREVAVRGGGYFLYGDTNGDKTADLTIFVSSSTPPLPNSDIVL